MAVIYSTSILEGSSRLSNIISTLSSVKRQVRDNMFGLSFLSYGLAIALGGVLPIHMFDTNRLHKFSLAREDLVGTKKETANVLIPSSDTLRCITFFLIDYCQTPGGQHISFAHSSLERDLLVAVQEESYIVRKLCPQMSGSRWRYIIDPPRNLRRSGSRIKCCML